MQSQTIDRLQINVRIFSAIALFAMAGALVYFTFELARIGVQVPEVIQSIDRTADKFDPVIREVEKIRVLVPPILEEMEQTRATAGPAIEAYMKTSEQIPRILDEYAATREMLPDLLPGLLKTADNLSFAAVTVTREVGANREMLPAMQKTADKAADALVILAEQVEASQPLLPEVLETADHASSAVIVISREMEAIRPLLPEILAEVEKTRESIPPMLNDANRLVANARQAGKEASQGATSGFLSGILMAPFVLVGDVGKALVGSNRNTAAVLTDTDYDMIEATTSELLMQGDRGQTKNWNNRDSGNSGTVKLMDVTFDPDEERECRVLSIEVRNEQKPLSSVLRTLCRNENGEWDFDR